MHFEKYRPNLFGAVTFRKFQKHFITITNTFVQAFKYSSKNNKKCFVESFLITVEICFYRRTGCPSEIDCVLLDAMSLPCSLSGDVD